MYNADALLMFYLLSIAVAFMVKWNHEQTVQKYLPWYHSIFATLWPIAILRYPLKYVAKFFFARSRYRAKARDFPRARTLSRRRSGSPISAAMLSSC